MLKTYLKTAIRSLAKNKFFSLINVLGLSIGISAALVIYLIVAYDFGFDQFEKDKERIYRVVTNNTYSGEPDYSSGMCFPLANALKKEVTGVDIVAPFSMWSENTKITIPGDATTKLAVYKKQERIIFADENYFNLLGYQWLSGSAGASLAQPYQVVLTASNAKKFFPALPVSEIPGKKIIFDDSIQTIVTGVVKDITEKTDFTFTTFVSRATQEHTSLRPDYWFNWNYSLSTSQLMVKLSAGSSAAHIAKQINALDKKYNKPDSENNIITNYALQPLNNIHFNDSYGTFEQRVAHKSTLYGLLAVAGFILLLGCINFINLTTAQASQRAKETGIRKTMGSSRRQLIFQFLGETFLLTFIATLLSILIAPLLLKVFSEFIPQGLHYRLQPDVSIFLLLLLLIVSLLSGFYPALILSAYKPVAILKKQSGTGPGKTRSASMRKILTVSQFVIAQVFIIATLLVSKQIHYSLNKDMGFKKEAILYFKSSFYDTSVSKRIHLMEKLKSVPEIQMVSLANDPPSANNEWFSILTYRDGKKEIEKQVQIKLADTNYIKLYGMKLLAGANLPWSDTIKNLLINETYAHSLGFINPQQAIGKYIEWDHKNLLIAGVVADFHPRSLHKPIKPLIITSRIRGEFAFNVALLPQNAAGTRWKTAIGKIEKAWKEVYPENDFEYRFVDDIIARYYKAEQNLSHLLGWATGLTIFISCLGLLGLVTYITHQRTKEIGVRKVIGASVTQIVLLLSKDFIKLVLVAFLIAVPVSWWGAHQWLQNFAYHTTIGAWIFLAGGLILLSLALLVLGIRTFRAALANPVEALRNE